MADAEPGVVPAVEATADDIATMEIRGAATIADAAAAALATQAERSGAESPAAFRRQLRAAARTLYETRPTAVSLPNALRYVLRGMDGETVADLRASTIARAEAFRRDLERAQETLGEIGANRLRDGDVVMTTATRRTRWLVSTSPSSRGNRSKRSSRKPGRANRATSRPDSSGSGAFR